MRLEFNSTQCNQEEDEETGLRGRHACLPVEWNEIGWIVRNYKRHIIKKYEGKDGMESVRIVAHYFSPFIVSSLHHSNHFRIILVNVVGQGNEENTREKNQPTRHS